MSYELAFISASELRQALDFPALVVAMAEAFRYPAEVPERLHYQFGKTGEEGEPEKPRGGMLIMPAWRDGQAIGCKLLNMMPANTRRGIAANNGLYCLFDSDTGLPQAVMDAAELTALRTSATSALAASYLARKSASKLLIVGAGKIAHSLAPAFRAVRPVSSVRCWARNPAEAQALANHIGRELGSDVDVGAVADLAAASREADIVTCATRAVEPLVRGEWIAPGTHLDLIGGYRPDMREVDDSCIRNASIFVDTREGALREAGDLIIPIANGLIHCGDIRAELADLVFGRHPGRAEEREITLFKSVGHASEDLAAARLAFARIRGSTGHGQ